jgi:hypothetical protein
MVAGLAGSAEETGTFELPDLALELVFSFRLPVASKADPQGVCPPRQDAGAPDQLLSPGQANVLGAVFPVPG